MVKKSDHEHIPSTTLNRKWNWILFMQFLLVALVVALYILGK